MGTPWARWKHAAVAAVLVIGGSVVFDWTRWVAFDANVKSRVVPTIGLPNVEQVVSLKTKVLAEASAFWISEGALTVDMHCEKHVSKGLGLNEDPKKLHWYLVVEGRYRGRVAKWEQRLDNGLPEIEGEALEAAGVRIVRPNAPQGG
jgi:hypothetical protein